MSPCIPAIVARSVCAASACCKLNGTTTPVVFLPPFPSLLQWYWQQLVDKVAFRSVYEDAPGSQQPLIWGRNI